LINQGEISQKDIRFFLGYSGWDTDQLCDELSHNSWIVIKNKYQSNIIEQKYNSELWKEKMMELGGNYIIWSNAPENPTLN
jgi:putative transcriptional regulator